jgi:hypothetical protein
VERGKRECMDGKMEGWERLKGGRPVLTLCVRLTPIIAAIVLSAKCAIHPLSRAGRPRLIHSLGLRASVKSCCCPWPKLEELEDGGGVDAEKCRSERAHRRAGRAARRKVV